MLIQASFDGHLQQMASELPDDYRLTLVARNTKRPDADIIMTRDDLQEVSRAVLAIDKK